MAPSRVAYDREEDLAKASPTPRVLPVDFDEAAFSDRKSVV